MINRSNWKLVKKYLEHREHVDQLSEGSMKIERTYLRYLLEWADDASFKKAASIRPTLPEYLLSPDASQRIDKLSANYIKKIISTARRFFEWLGDYQRGYRFSKMWLDTLRPKRMEEPPKKKEAVSFQEILAISRANVDDLIEERIRAAAVFWYLSGIRIGAFVSLPLAAVDIEKREVKQFPSLGVRTKYGKYATTFLLDIPELLKVVERWDRQVRAVLPENGFWFAPLSPDTGEIDPAATSIGQHRSTLATKNLRAWLIKVGLPYRSPHKFRHGHIQYGMKHSKTIEDYKAVSMNVMHSEISTTDEIYSRLKDEDIRGSISRISNNSGSKSSEKEEMFELFAEFLRWQEQQDK